MFAYKNLKVVIDWIFALILVLVTIPIIILFGVLLKVEDPSDSIIFKQRRIGKNNEIFTLYKLRSMTAQTEYKGLPLSDDERLLKIGSVIRKTSIDELPQLFNILKGEMSFIGPRPLFVEYLPYYTDRERKRHNVKPGISGWAQVNGRNSLSWEEKFELDLDYIERYSLMLDLKIFILTLKKLIERSDIVENRDEGNQDLDYLRMNQPNS